MNALQSLAQSAEQPAMMYRNAQMLAWLAVADAVSGAVIRLPAQGDGGGRREFSISASGDRPAASF